MITGVVDLQIALELLVAVLALATALVLVDMPVANLDQPPQSSRLDSLTWCRHERRGRLPPARCPGRRGSGRKSYSGRPSSRGDDSVANANGAREPRC